MNIETKPLMKKIKNKKNQMKPPLISMFEHIH